MNNRAFSFDQRLDKEFLQSIYEEDVRHACEIFGLFIDTTPNLLNDVDQSFGDGVVESVRVTVHKLKPAFSFVGLTELAQKAEKLEQKCQQTSNINDIKDLYFELKENYAQSFPIVEKEFRRLKNQMSQSE